MCVVVDGEPLNMHQDPPALTRVDVATISAIAAPLVPADPNQSLQELMALDSTSLPRAIGRRVTLAPDPPDLHFAGPFRLQPRLMIFVLTAIFCGTAYAQTAAVPTEVQPDQGAVKVTVSGYSDDAFEIVAAKYRAENPKSPFPEEARKFRIQAEFAVQEKQFDRAVELYGKALEIAPWWPEGHFNRALILGQTKTYHDAIREMKRYLLLVPDAPDTRAAQDNIYQWEREVDAILAATSEAAAKAMWTDASTGLVWQREDDGRSRNRDESISYCRTLTLAGHSDWRLPSTSELRGLWKDVGSQDTARKTYFPTMKLDGYWSSDATWVGGGWPINFSDGSGWRYNELSGFYARCVRNEQ